MLLAINRLLAVSRALYSLRPELDSAECNPDVVLSDDDLIVKPAVDLQRFRLGLRPLLARRRQRRQGADLPASDVASVSVITYAR